MWQEMGGYKEIFQEAASLCEKSVKELEREKIWHVAEEA